jgi:putative ABC transport system substrate-binding protein
VALLGNPTNPSHAAQFREAEGAARQLRLRPEPVAARDPGEIENAFAAMRRHKPDAIIVLLGFDTPRSPKPDRRPAIKHRLPTVYGAGEHAQAGGLASYGPNIPSMFTRAAAYYDIKILRGARPTDLPVEQPTTFELVINLKTANNLGLTIPSSLRLRADHLIE